MNKSVIWQFEYFISQCKTIDEVESQENRIIRITGNNIPTELSKALNDKRNEILNRKRIKGNQ